MKITSTEYLGLEEAYNFLNQELFNNELPGCLITMQRKSKSAGFYSPDQFINRAGKKDKKAYTDEISLNPATFGEYSDMEILSTMLHEMCHLWQEKFGKPSRKGWHNKEWAAKMESVGLMPSSTGEPGGKRVGQKMSDYVIKGGVFEQKAKELIQKGFRVNWESVYQITKRRPQPGPGIESPLGEVEEGEDQTNKKNKVKYTCPSCKINAWGKPGLKLICGECNLNLLSGEELKLMRYFTDEQIKELEKLAQDVGMMEDALIKRIHYAYTEGMEFESLKEWISRWIPDSKQRLDQLEEDIKELVGK